LITYFDSSALLKLFLNEPDAQVALDIWNEAEQIATSSISYLEVHAGLARAMRENPPRHPKQDTTTPKSSLTNCG
jgi:uncharacterized protein